MSESFDVGDTVVMQLNIDADLEPWETDVTVTKPDGTEATPSVHHDEDGQYSATMVIDQPGPWKHHWSAGSSTDGDWSVRETRKFYVRFSTA